MPHLSGIRPCIGLSLVLVGLSPAAHGTQVTDVQRLDLRRANTIAAAAARMGQAATPTARHTAALELRAGEALVPVASGKNFAGHHYRYQQTYLGWPIQGKEIAVTEDGRGRIKAMFGNIVTGLQQALPAPPAPRLSTGQAWDLARKSAFAPRLPKECRGWWPLSSEGWAFSKERIAPVLLVIGTQPRAAYKVTFLANGPAPNPGLEMTVFIDAMSGAPLARQQESSHADIGMGPGGNLGTGLYEYGGHKPYLDVTQKAGLCHLRNKDVRTLNFKGGKSDGEAVSFTCPRHDEGHETNGAYSALNDAHHGATVTFDMYRDFLGVVPWPEQVPIKVHWGEAFSNAFWREGAVHLGDGNQHNYPWVALDIVAHEISHGYTAWHSKLVSTCHHSHAIKESFSDMGGEAAEFYANGTTKFVFGEEVRKSGVPIRYLHNPKLKPGSIDHASEFTEPMMEPHAAAGVFDKAFHLLATTPGWDTKKAFQVFAFANAWHWTPETTFNQAACGVEFSAEEYRYPRDDVTAAFSAVGVSCGLVWNKRTAIGVWGGPLPLFSKDRRTISTDQEPPDGEFGIASRTSISRQSGKRYAEFKFEKQRNAQVFQYSGGICLSLRLDSTPIDLPFPECGETGDWAIRWFTDAETSPVARINPFFRANGRILWGFSDNLGPLGAWRITEGDTVGMAIDLDQGRIWYALNGAWEGDPASGAAPAFDQAVHGQPFAGQSASLFFFSDFQLVQVKICERQSDGCHPPPAGFGYWSD